MDPRHVFISCSLFHMLALGMICTGAYVPFMLKLGLELADIQRINIVFFLTIFFLEIPTGALADGKSRRWSVTAGYLALEHLLVGYVRWLRLNSLDAQAAVTHHPRSRSASAGRDSLRSVGHAANAATFLRWKRIRLFFQTSQFQLHTSSPASCSRRIRLASLPSRPSFARRPCLATSVHSVTDLCELP